MFKKSTMEREFEGYAMAENLYPKKETYVWLPQMPQVLGGVVHGTTAIVPSRDSQSWDKHVRIYTNNNPGLR